MFWCAPAAHTKMSIPDGGCSGVLQKCLLNCAQGMRDVARFRPQTSEALARQRIFAGESPRFQSVSLLG